MLWRCMLLCMSATCPPANHMMSNCAYQLLRCEGVGRQIRNIRLEVP